MVSTPRQTLGRVWHQVECNQANCVVSIDKCRCSLQLCATELQTNAARLSACAQINRASLASTDPPAVQSPHSSSRADADSCSLPFVSHLYYPVRVRLLPVILPHTHTHTPTSTQNSSHDDAEVKLAALFAFRIKIQAPSRLVCLI
ncbi:unnamed protein product [Protopolystoma xenopodis]|uniref:Uncharacterized protein n=1 Tax=Protopolystoma xenopodis TaxID=117903 RepID=A0A448WWC5_9PLAT|nr:unnamed protein product [Protopolystoma xenopodis]